MKLIQTEINKWNVDLTEQPKLRTYKQYKNTFGRELYIECHLPKFHRTALAKLRSCTLPLAIETGRYTNVPREQRIWIWIPIRILWYNF